MRPFSGAVPPRALVMVVMLWSIMPSGRILCVLVLPLPLLMPGWFWWKTKGW